MPQYKKTEGHLVPVSVAKRITELYQKHNDPERKQLVQKGATTTGDSKKLPDLHYVEAEFFGLESFEKLMKESGGSPVGFRVYYGYRNEDHSGVEPEEAEVGKKGSKFTPRLVIVPVDSHGVDLTGMIGVGGLKDGGPESNALVGGPLCPKHCGR